ncbi:MAG: hypothetical protein RL095_2182 [Verrucomicrobiota bacterium]|jgi:hypothetical protein
MIPLGTDILLSIPMGLEEGDSLDNYPGISAYLFFSYGSQRRVIAAFALDASDPRLEQWQTYLPLTSYDTGTETGIELHLPGSASLGKNWWVGKGLQLEITMADAGGEVQTLDPITLDERFGLTAKKGAL